MGSDTRSGGPDAVKKGQLKRRLDPVVIAEVGAFPTGIVVGTIAQSLKLENLSANLYCGLLVCFVRNDGGRVTYPATPGTVQFTPSFKGTMSNIAYARPVFQDPAASEVVNAPLAHNLPDGWEFQSVFDEVYIDVVIDIAQWAANVPINSPPGGRIECQAQVEFNGNWWDAQAIAYIMGQVQLSGISESKKINTG